MNCKGKCQFRCTMDTEQAGSHSKRYLSAAQRRPQYGGHGGVLAGCALARPGAGAGERASECVGALTSKDTRCDVAHSQSERASAPGY
jgi:hypothetical protein